MSTIVNLDGVLVPPAAATVSVFDRGFLYGDSVYEVIRTYGGRLFELDAHLARLGRSAQRLALRLPWDDRRLRDELARTLAVSMDADDDERGGDVAPWNVGERSVRIISTRGSGELGLDPALAVDPRVILIAVPLHGPPATAYRTGVSLRIVGIRHDAPEAIDTTAKTGAHIANVLALAEARAAGAHEALLLDRDGFVTEGASSNLFAVHAGVLETPPLAAGILEGVTREIVLSIARAAGLTVREIPMRPADLATATELFLTSTGREILPATSLDGHPVGGGTVGPVTTLLHRLFRDRADRVARGEVM